MDESPRYRVSPIKVQIIEVAKQGEEGEDVQVHNAQTVRYTAPNCAFKTFSSHPGPTDYAPNQVKPCGGLEPLSGGSGVAAVDILGGEVAEQPVAESHGATCQRVEPHHRHACARGAN